MPGYCSGLGLEARELGGLRIAQLLVEGLQGLFEHAAVRRGGRAAEVLGGAGAGELQRAALFPPQQFGFTQAAHSGSRARCFLLLSFNRLGFPALATI